MISDQQALYRAILANPADDTPRLVYADWLDENGRGEEAEFLRVGCRLAAVPPDDPGYVGLLARREELANWLAAHVPGPSPRFAAGLELEGGPSWWHNTHRGFPRYLEFEGEDRPGLKPIRTLASALEKAFATVPTRMLAIRWVTVDQLAEFLRQPVIEQLDAATIQLRVETEPAEEAARLVAACPRLRNLRGMCLAFDPGEAGFAALAASGHLGGLEWLSAEPGTLTPAAVRTLGGTAWFRNLRELTLHDFLPYESFAELCRLGPFPRLHTLDLGGHITGNLFSAAGWEVFAGSEAFPALTRLELKHTDLSTNGAMRVLAGCRWFRPAFLDLSHCAIGRDGAEALAAAPWLSSLRWLGLAVNSLGPTGVRAVAGSRNLSGLRHLDLSVSTPGVSGLRAIASNPALRGLRSLHLSGYSEANRGLIPVHLHEFLTSLDMPELRHLDLCGRRVGPKGAGLLAGDKFRSLTRLELGTCGLTDAAAAALLTAPALQNLITLDLSYNGLRDGLKPLADRRTLPRLGDCALMGNRPGAELAAKLARRPGVRM